MAPGRVVTCVARVPSDDAAAGSAGATPTTPSELRALIASPSLDVAAELLGRGSLDVIGFASTSCAYAIGVDAEEAVVSRLSRRIGTPVLATCASAILALRVLEVERIALVDPPWFDAELNELGAAYFESGGFDVVSSTSADLSRDDRRIEASAVYEWTSRHIGEEAEAVFIGGNGFRAAGAVAALEAALGRPVLTSNQVLLWNLLTHAGATFEVSGYGRLFRAGSPVCQDGARRKEALMNRAVEGAADSLAMDEALEEARRHVRRKRIFYIVLGVWLALSLMWFLIDLTDDSSSFWFFWPMLGTGIGVAITGIVLLGIGGLFGAEWERREVDKYLRRRGNEPPG